MPQSNHQIARDFFTALSNGTLSAGMFTADMTAWTTTSGESSRDRYLAGVTLLQSLFPAGLTYTVDSLTAEGDRVAAEVRSRGTLIDGKTFQNTYVFVLRIRDERIAGVAEHFNPQPVRDLILPLVQAEDAGAARAAP
jgi:ketosteroid isomerase-like protein